MKIPSSIVTLLILIVIVTGIAFMFYHQSEPLATPSQLVLSPTQSVSPTSAADPVVISWTTYNNDKYNFTIDKPSDWNQQEYTLPSGGFLIAFSPNTLPCATCSYVHNGFYSVKVFNQQTDADAYKNYTTAMQNIGKSAGYQKAQLDNHIGVLFGNAVSVENNGWVYQVTLDANNGNQNAEDSKLFVKAATSMKFTNLIFTK